MEWDVLLLFFLFAYTTIGTRISDRSIGAKYSGGWKILVKFWYI